MKRELFVLVTMDCERVRSESYYGDGTESWEMSQRAIEGMAGILRDEAMKGTFLPTPATAARQARLFQELQGEGFEIGLQFHCDSFRDGEHRQPLGTYGYDKQKEILSLAKADWEDALGSPLVTYRSGYLSANDFTFPILAELGIRQTSCSKAGRYVPLDQQDTMLCSRDLIAEADDSRALSHQLCQGLHGRPEDTATAQDV